MIEITDELINQVTSEAKEDPRLRKNYNFHKDLNDPVNRMLNALEPGTYLRPHRHLETGKTGVLLLLKGSLKVVFFDDEGLVVNSVILSKECGVHGIEIAPDEWYSIIVLEEGTVVYEIKPGPYVPLSENAFASWSPLPDDKEAVDEFLNRLI